MKNIEVGVLQRYMDKGVVFLDVREAYEQPKFNLPNHLSIPMSELSARIGEIPKDKEVCVYCQSGVRSYNVVEVLSAEYGYDNLINIVGGASSMALVLSFS